MTKRHKDGRYAMRSIGRQSGGRWKNEERREWTDEHGRKQEGKFDRLGRRVPRHKPASNVGISAEPSDWYVAETEHPTQGQTLRCHLCGEWYHLTPLGVDWGAGQQRMRWAAEAAGDKGGGYRSRRAVLWAMHTEKRERFIMRHERAHGQTVHVDRYFDSFGRYGWPEYDYLRLKERVSPPDMVGRRKKPDPEKWNTEWIRWFRANGQVWQLEPRSRLYLSPSGAKRCPRATLEMEAPVCRVVKPAKAERALAKARRKRLASDERSRRAERARPKRGPDGLPVWDPDNPLF